MFSFVSWREQSTDIKTKTKVYTELGTSMQHDDRWRYYMLQFYGPHGTKWESAVITFMVLLYILLYKRGNNLQICIDRPVEPVFHGPMELDTESLDCIVHAHPLNVPAMCFTAISSGISSSYCVCQTLLAMDLGKSRAMYVLDQRSARTRMLFFAASHQHSTNMTCWKCSEKLVLILFFAF